MASSFAGSITKEAAETSTTRLRAQINTLSHPQARPSTATAQRLRSTIRRSLSHPPESLCISGTRLRLERFGNARVVSVGAVFTDREGFARLVLRSQDVRVDHGRRQVTVAEELLHGADVRRSSWAAYSSSR